MIASTLIKRKDPDKIGPTRLLAGETPATHPITILFVGHPKDETDLITRSLAENYSLCTARSEVAATRMIKCHPIDLIVINFRAFDSEGADFCAQLKTSSPYAHIPIILVIDENSMLSRIRTLAAGADAYIERPLSGKLLKAQITNILTNRARLKDHFACFTAAGTIGQSYRSIDKEKLMDILNTIITENLTSDKLDAPFLARQINMSRPTLYRKVKSLFDTTPHELISITRLNRAAALLANSDHKIAEVSKMAGYGSLANFGKAFLKHFNLNPSAYRQLKKG